MDKIQMDKIRYIDEERMPLFQLLFRYAQRGGLLGKLYKVLFIIARRERKIDLSVETNIGGGIYFGHAFGITINQHSVIGCNVNIHKGVTIGRENRGTRKGAPEIGNDVMIAPNSFVNFDVPDHSIVFGNPAVIRKKDNATESYINNKVCIEENNML